MKYFLGFLICIALIVGVFILVLKGFSGGSTPKNLAPLTDYSNTDTVMQMTVDGPIVSDQQHQAYRVTIGQTLTTISTLQGYDYNVVGTKSYPNTQNGYYNFLAALDLAGFQKGQSKKGDNDPRGVCATGSRFDFQIINDSGSNIKNYWSTTCRSTGNFKGNTGQVQSLFDAQIPSSDFSQLTQDLDVSL